jgi:tetratricopeptide (TPR) repeat protein
MRNTALSLYTRRSGRVALLCFLAASGGPATLLQAQGPPPKALPVEERTDAGPAPAPRPPKATPVPETEVEPAPRRAQPAPAASPRPPAADGVPRTPEDDLFDYCEMLFTKANYALAYQQYAKYLEIHPNGKHREETVFKMGECRYLTDTWGAALEYFDAYLRDFPNGANRAVALYHAGESHYKLAGRSGPEGQAEHVRLAVDNYRATVQVARTGPYVCYSAFRLGSFSYNAAQRDPERYKEAARWFTLAASEAPKTQPRIRVTSLFFLGRSQRYLRQNKDAAATFLDLTRIKEENTYFDQAWQELAQMDMEAGRTEEAMKKFERLSKDSVDAETKASSLVNSGMLHAEAGRSAEAISRFEEALKIPGEKTRGARARARFGLVWSSYKELADDKVIEAWRGLQGEDYGDMDEITRARLWLIVGTSYAAQDKHSPAAQTFRLLENLVNVPERQVREACQEGGYKRIVSLFKLNDPTTVEAVDEYVRIWQERTPEITWIDKAWLVRGAWYFNRSVWDHAAKSYKNVRGEKLEPEKQVTWLYQRGCAEASSGDADAVTTLTTFLARAPADERATMAQLQRGLVRLKLEDHTAALTDFEEVAAKVPGTEAGETAAYNAARVRGIKQDFPGMVAGFTKLLADYPKTRAAAEAHYWIGTGNYQLQKYKECLEPLRTSRSLDSKSYFQDASLMIIAALAARQDVDGLIPEVDAYLKAGGARKINQDILRWLGMTLFRERKDYARAARYLGLIVTFAEPEKTAADIWAAHGECLLEIRDFAGSIAALDNYLKTEQRPSQRARGYLLRGRAQIALKKHEDAAKSVEEGLNLDRESLVAAQLHMLAGDVSAASSREVEAVGSYNLVRLTWEDPVLTPTALSKMIAILSKSTDPKKLADAEERKKELAERFPRFTPQP